MNHASGEPAPDVRHAIALHVEGKLDAAADAYRAILLHRPDEGTCWSNLGVALRALGRKEEGLDVLRRGVRASPDFADLHYNLGNALSDAGDWEGASERYRAVLDREPRHLKAALSCGRALENLKRYGAALDHYRAALRIHPDNAKLYYALGRLFFVMQRLRPALAAFRRAIAIGQVPPRYRLDLSDVLSALGNYAESEQHLRQALDQAPDSPDVLVALGNNLAGQGHLEKALQSFEAALAVESEHLGARLGRARANLLAGRYIEGWQDFGWRRRHRSWKSLNAEGRPWNGQDIHGQSILLVGEQGLGDVIQVARYAPLLARRGAEVSLYVPVPLARLLRRLDGVARVIPDDDPAPTTDWVCLLWDLPGIFGTDLNSIPDSCPYLHSDSLPRPLLPPTRQFRMGVVWAGNPAHDRDRERSCRLEDFAPLIALPGTEFVSFQVGTRATERTAGGFRGLVEGLDGVLDDFAATADALAEIDLLITVDTAIAHLAGALGRPVWNLLTFAPDWRWLLGRSDTPWYPTMRLFRQPEPGDWAGVFRQVRAALVDELERRSVDTRKP